MNLTVNGEARSVENDLTVSALVGQVAASSRGIAVARNGEVVPKSMWTDVALVEGDQIEVLEAAQGG